MRAMAKLIPAVLFGISVAGASMAQQVAPPTTAAETVNTRIGALTFTHKFADGYPTDATVKKLHAEMDFQRATQAYLWALPLVAFQQWQNVPERQFGAADGDLVLYRDYADKAGILTANATTEYVLSFIDVSRTGPVVVEMQARLASEPAHFTRLMQACHAGDAPGADRALTFWLDCLALPRIALAAETTTDAALAGELHGLQEALIGRRPSWSGTALASQLRAWRHHNARRERHHPAAARLPELNPTGEYALWNR